MPELTFIIVYILTGITVGFIAGLLGAGGGGILVPLLTAIFTWQGINPEYAIHLALGTALSCMILSSAASTRAHAARQAIAWKLVGGLAVGISAGAFLTTHVAAVIKPFYIAVFFSAFMALIALQVFIKWQPSGNNRPIRQQELITSGFFIGAVSALAAVGGGFLSVMYLSYKNIDIKRAVAASAAIGLPLAIVGSVGYMISGWSDTLSLPLTLGYVYLPAFVVISVSSVLMAPLGVRCSHALPEASLKKIFAILSLLLSIRMLFSVSTLQM